MPALDDRLAMHAELREVGGRGAAAVGVLVVQGASEDARCRGLADAAHAGQHPGLRDAAGREGVGQRPDHGVLADQVAEMRRSVFARQNAIARWRCGRGWRRGHAGETRLVGGDGLVGHAPAFANRGAPVNAALS